MTQAEATVAQCRIDVKRALTRLASALAARKNGQAIAMASYNETMRHLDLAVQEAGALVEKEKIWLQQHLSNLE